MYLGRVFVSECRVVKQHCVVLRALLALAVGKIFNGRLTASPYHHLLSGSPNSMTGKVQTYNVLARTRK